MLVKPFNVCLLMITIYVCFDICFRHFLDLVQTKALVYRVLFLSQSLNVCIGYLVLPLNVLHHRWIAISSNIAPHLRILMGTLDLVGLYIAYFLKLFISVRLCKFSLLISLILLIFFKYSTVYTCTCICIYLYMELFISRWLYSMLNGNDHLPLLNPMI